MRYLTDIVLISDILNFTNIALAWGDICEDRAGCIGCPPGNCWVCASIGDIVCYKPAPYPV
ncbi:hypothetical protein JGI20_01338 [Candidatus Kryptobacter tengchongensis]|uniref:Uncharacterized protein n=1 Tax=Kryptobacter tengchongensis TaxID=1643429 RepID=A0A916PCW7_KRYT1|nr:hypothetical protein JGI20_01338 [Candidatus Kryptobacter tengchongensis]CUT05613.1 hypothetical protein JGI25_01615 [Candidatus Kryptobacter tengchongensis]